MDLDIFIVAYQRPAILDYTLTNLYKQLTAPRYFRRINLSVWVNDFTDEDVQVMLQASKNRPDLIYNFHVEMSIENKGKAHALNHMYEKFANPDGHILTLDQDMVFYEPFIPILEDAVSGVNFEILGFASDLFWGHRPEKGMASSFVWNNYTIHYTRFISGGMMLFPSYFLDRYKWTNEDGIYGGDDYNMCMNTDRKFILEKNTSWFTHDPLGPDILEYQEYYQKKSVYTDQGIYVLPVGWYK